VTTDNEVQVSVCIKCARHPSLKRIIEEKSVVGVCAFCCRDDVVVRDHDDAEPMVMLIRSLIRLNWDEFEYNGHWGGDSVLKLFDNPDNVVVEPPVADTYHDDFNFLLQEPTYPPIDQGVALYAGNDEDGTRLLQFKISGSEPHVLREIRIRLHSEEFEAVAPAVEAMIDPFLADIEFVLSGGGTWWRARTGVEKLYRRTKEWESVIVRQPYTDGAIAAPSPEKAGMGRLNRQGLPVLYLASKPYTALAEIRPHPGHYVSVGTFETIADLRMADFDPDIALFAANDVRLDLYAIVQALDSLMSTPVTPDDKTGYLVTQLLAKVLQARGFDGVQYRSSVSDGVNICLFDPANGRFVGGNSEVRFIESVTYAAASAPSLMEPGPGDWELGPARTKA
jgi:hypothetical protein